MKKLKLGIAGFNALQLAAKARGIVTSMTANPNFPTPNPALAAIQTAAENLQESAEEAEISGSRYSINLRNSQYIILADLMRTLGAWVQSASGGDPLKISSSGFEVAQQGGNPVGILSPVNNLKAFVSQYFPGQVTLEWDRIKRGCKSYTVSMCMVDPDNPEAVWEELATVSQSRFVVTGLTPGSAYWFRVVAIGAAGPGGLCTPVKQIVY